MLEGTAIKKRTLLSGASTDFYVINYDSLTSILEYLEAEKFVLLTNVTGVLSNPEDPDSLISSLTVEEVHNLIKKNVITAGMIPKVSSCIEALNGGVKKTHIIDARLNHALLLEIFTDQGVGTQIIQ